ncbi:MAG: methyltransferase domain-containing protein [Syntrophotaleaceae bacterium]
MIGNQVDFRRVRRQFSGSAGSYDHHAEVQKAVVERLASMIAAQGPPAGPVVDIGTGTGLLAARLNNTWPQVSLILSDLSHDMTRSACERVGCGNGTDADCQTLPFATASIGLVASSSVFQWLEDLRPAFIEIARVLKPGGRFAFALFGSGTLCELQYSYRVAASEAGRQVCHLHTFPDAEIVLSAMREAGFEHPELHQETLVEYHGEVTELLRSLKNIGAANASPLRPRGLASRRIMHRMMARYRQQYAGERGIPATYEVIYGFGVKSVRSEE